MKGLIKDEGVVGDAVNGYFTSPRCLLIRQRTASVCVLRCMYLIFL